MTYTIAMAGKGGTGKTTITGMLIEYLAEKSKGPILAVDADANENLNEVLGVDIEATLGDIREVVARAEDQLENPIPSSMTKQEFLQYKLSNALTEEDNYDLLVMGRTQGKGCYCFVNDLLTAQLRKISSNYNYIVVDNEAGMEHISRGILPAVDMIILVSDCSRRGIQAVGRIAEMVRTLNLNPSIMKLIVNRAPEGKLDPGIEEEIKKQGLDLLGVLPHDAAIYEADCAGQPTATLPDTAAAKSALYPLLDELFKEAKEAQAK